MSKRTAWNVTNAVTAMIGSADAWAVFAKEDGSCRATGTGKAPMYLPEADVVSIVIPKRGGAFKSESLVRCLVAR